MRASDFYNNIFDLMPEAEIDTDNDGQIIIYTNMKEKGRILDGTAHVVPIDEED